jgi:hypothetical protein
LSRQLNLFQQNNNSSQSGSGNGNGSNRRASSQIFKSLVD